jgi:hypothetical protein
LLNKIFTNFLLTKFSWIGLLLSISINSFSQSKIKMAFDKYSKKNYDLIILPSIDYSPETSLRLGAFVDYYYKLGKKTDTNTRQSLSWIELLYTLKHQLFFQVYSSSFTKNNQHFIGTRAGFTNNI